jgi:hypothetical protein
MTTQEQTIHPALDRIQRPALVVGAAGLLLTLVGLFIGGEDSRGRALTAYLYSYLFWLGLALGSLALLMLQHMVGGKWGLVLRRMFEAATRVLPVMALLFLPILIGMGTLYVWTHNGGDHPAAADAHGGGGGGGGGHGPTAFRQAWLSTPFFIARAVFYFAVWIVLAFILNTWSDSEDKNPRTTYVRRFQMLSSGGIVLYALTLTFAGIDWVMTLNPHWYSTMFGVLFMVGQAVGTMSFMIAVLVLFHDREPISKLINPGLFQDLGTLLFAFIMLWAYVNFSQFLIIWSGNLSEETPYYIYRSQGGWKALSIFLIVFHFVFPFIILLSRYVKRSGPLLQKVAIVLIVMRFVDLFWTCVPMFIQGVHHEDPQRHPSVFHWLDLVAPLGIGGIFVFMFIWQLKRRPILPLHDPRLEEVADHHG